MKKGMLSVLITMVMAGSILGCVTHLPPNYFGGWTETQIPFMASISHVDKKDGYLEIVTDHKWGGNHQSEDFSWIRNPENMFTVHQTIKKLGYKNFISEAAYFSPMNFQDHYGGMTRLEWEGLSVAQVIDSLIVNYLHIGLDKNYFQKFWSRRKVEGTDTVLLQVLTEVKNIYEPTQTPMINPQLKFNQTGSQLSNDTLENLLQLDLRLQEYDGKPTAAFLWQYFHYLRSIGLDHSAYNLVVEEYESQIQPDTVIQMLQLHLVSEYVYWDTRNNGKWIRTYRDNGP